MSTSPPPSGSTTHQLNLGLRWLDADNDEVIRCRGLAQWRDFLAQAERLPAPRRLAVARLWPLLGAVNGVLAISGLLVWPDGSGVHLLLFLLAFWAAPLLLISWTTLSGVVLGRCPWWHPLITPYRDRMIALWFARQSLLAQGAFCLTGLAWLWLMLLSRQIIFYWSTSVPAVATAVESLFRTLGLGVATTPNSARIAAAEAGAITGWQGALLADSWGWAIWLSQVVALWLLLPIVLLLAVCQWRLVRGLADWPRWNHRLRQRYEQCREPALNYRTLQPQPSPADIASGPFPRVSSLPAEPGFAWQLTDAALPAGSHSLGAGSYQADHQTVLARSGQLRNWYIAASAVPTGDLADLLQLHLSRAAQPRLFIVCDGEASSRLDTQQHSWGAFLARNDLDLPVTLVSGGPVTEPSPP